MHPITQIAQTQASMIFANLSHLVNSNTQNPKLQKISQQNFFPLVTKHYLRAQKLNKQKTLKNKNCLHKTLYIKPVCRQIVSKQFSGIQVIQLQC